MLVSIIHEQQVPPCNLEHALCPHPASGASGASVSCNDNLMYTIEVENVPVEHYSGFDY